MTFRPQAYGVRVRDSWPQQAEGVFKILHYTLLKGFCVLTDKSDWDQSPLEPKFASAHLAGEALLLLQLWSSHCISSKCWQQCSTETWISTTLHWLQMCPLLAILEEPNTLWRWLNEKIKITLTYVSLTNMVEVPFTEPKWTEGCLPHSLSTCVLHTELSSDQMPPCIVPSSE